MHFHSILYVIGTLLLVTSIAMIFPILISLIFNDGDLNALLISAGITFGIGIPFWLFPPNNYQLTFKDALLIAVFGWVIISIVSALPFIFHGSIPQYPAAGRPRGNRIAKQSPPNAE